MALGNKTVFRDSFAHFLQHLLDEDGFKFPACFEQLFVIDIFGIEQRYMFAFQVQAHEGEAVHGIY